MDIHHECRRTTNRTKIKKTNKEMRTAIEIISFLITVGSLFMVIWNLLFLNFEVALISGIIFGFFGIVFITLIKNE